MRGKRAASSLVEVVLGLGRITHRGKPVAELEGGSVIVFCGLTGAQDGRSLRRVDCRVISYAWDCVSRSLPLIGGNGMLGITGAALCTQCNKKCEIQYSHKYEVP